MEKAQIINQFVSDPEYRQICRQVADTFADDLYQELALIILELPEDKLSRLHETCLKCFFYRMAQKQFCSRNSNFYKKYLKHERIAREHAADIQQAWMEDAVDPDLMTTINEIMDSIYWYDSGILSLYAEKGTHREVSELTGIPMKSVWSTVDGARKLIKKKLRKYE